MRDLNTVAAMSLCVLLADNKNAETKENQEVPLERLDDIHDVMVGPVAWYWDMPWPF